MYLRSPFSQLRRSFSCVINYVFQRHQLSLVSNLIYYLYQLQRYVSNNIIIFRLRYRKLLYSHVLSTYKYRAITFEGRKKKCNKRARFSAAESCGNRRIFENNNFTMHTRYESHRKTCYDIMPCTVFRRLFREIR